MIDHFSLQVRSVARMKKFYVRALKPLGYRALRSYPGAVGFGAKKPVFWIVTGKPHRLHVAFEAKTRGAVDRFFEAAMKAGAKDNGKPGVRSQYHAHYYGAFIHDPEGNNSEAVCH